MTTAKEYRDRSVEDLAATHQDLCKQLFDLRCEQRGGNLEKPHRVKETRRDIARLRTVMREKREVKA